tara:strand:- start:393 stop:2222 length:1830 start_codon:yes stop_codon:yes gene_type:complete
MELKKDLLTELNRNREIMGLTPLLEQESDDVMSISREKECPCLDDSGKPDGTTSPGCCDEWTEQDQQDYEKFQKKYGGPPSFAKKYSSLPGVRELKGAYLQEILNLAKEQLPIITKKVKDSEVGEGYGLMVNLKNSISEMNRILEMSEDEFLSLDLTQQVIYARNEKEKKDATQKWTLNKLKRDKDWTELQKQNRIKNTSDRDSDFEELRVSTSKLMKGFIKKLDRKSKKRWANKDKAYNEKGWVMTDEDKKGLFKVFRDYFIEWRDMKRNRKYAKNMSDLKLLKKFFSEINLKNVKGPDELINLDPIKTEPTEPIVGCGQELGLQLLGVQDDEFTPFVNNSTELHQDLKDEINGVVIGLGNALKENPGVEYKISSYRIWTSASRARNGGAVRTWSFQKLSNARAQSVKTFIDNAFAKIGVKLPEPQIDSSGENNDGSSGPNPPYPFTMVKGSGPTPTTDEKDRDEFKKPYACEPTDGKFVCPEYDKFKFCMVDLGIEVYPPTTVPSEKPGEPGTFEDVKLTLPSRKWEIKFVPKEKYGGGSSYRLRSPIKFTLKRVNRKPKGKSLGGTLCPDFGGDGTRLAVGIATGPLIDQVVKNGLASYNTSWMSN